MKKIISFFAIVLFLSSCSEPKPLLSVKTLTPINTEVYHSDSLDLTVGYITRFGSNEIIGIKKQYYPLITLIKKEYVKEWSQLPKACVWVGLYDLRAENDARYNIICYDEDFHAIGASFQGDDYTTSLLGIKDIIEFKDQMFCTSAKHDLKKFLIPGGI